MPALFSLAVVPSLTPSPAPAPRPIKVLRLFVSVFFQVFFIAALGVFLVAVNCHFLASEPETGETPKYLKHRVHAFQDVGEWLVWGIYIATAWGLCRVCVCARARARDAHVCARARVCW